MLPFAPGITGYYAEENGVLFLDLKSLRNLSSKTFIIKDQTIINTIKQGFSPILEDYLGDSVPRFGDTFFEMQSHPIPADGEEREARIFSSVKMKFCWIPAGEAQLGSPKEERDYIAKNSYDSTYTWLEEESESVRGIHKSNGFWMGKYPVTQAQWKGVMEGDNPSHFKGSDFAYLKTDNLPVEHVNRYDCQRFITKCGIEGLQLPCEDQWEYACRGGKGNKQAFYWGNTLNGDEANCNGREPWGSGKQGNFLGATTEVGSYEKIAPHPWGLCDMIGNVFEWCSDVWSEDPINSMARGGSWYNTPTFCRSAHCDFFNSTYRYDLLGFRLIIC